MRNADKQLKKSLYISEEGELAVGRVCVVTERSKATQKEETDRRRGKGRRREEAKPGRGATS